VAIGNVVRSNVVKKTTYNKINNINPLNAELNPICHLLALLGAHHILHISGIMVKSCFILPSIFNKVNIISIFLKDVTKEHNKNVENKYTKFVKVDYTSIK